jgi:endonuclease G, mitochondrial
MMTRKIILIVLCFSFNSKQGEYDPLLYQRSNGHTVNHKSYIVCFDEDLKFTKWVSYILTDDMLRFPVCKRADDFRPDNKVNNSPQLTDYEKSGYDRGHLVNAQDMKFDSISESESFYLTNMAPQVPSFNRGIWLQLESQTREWVSVREKLYIIAGGILRDSIKYIGDSLPVPSHFYKIIYDCNKNTAVAFIIKNLNGKQSFKNYAVSIDQIERETDIDFLHSLEDSVENRIEASIDTSWFQN